MSKTYPKSPRNHLPGPAALCQESCSMQRQCYQCEDPPLGCLSTWIFQEGVFNPMLPFAPQQAVGSFDLKLYATVREHVQQ